MQRFEIVPHQFPILKHICVMPESHRYFMVYKPYCMLSQFVGPTDAPKLGDLDFDFPEGTHAIGRLDFHSEGLLLLTTNKKITKLLFQGKEPHKRTYLVQALYPMSESVVQQLRDGVEIRIRGGEYWVSSPCEADLVSKPSWLPPRNEEIPEFVPHCWLTISLTEGKFHQVRKMLMAVRHKCKRLIRTSIEDLHIEGFQAGEVREIRASDFFSKLKLDHS